MSYDARFTEDFEKLIESAKETIKPFLTKEMSRYTVYFKVKGEDTLLDCCDDDKCIKSTKIEIRKQYGKGTHIEHFFYDNDSDHDKIEICSICGKPLNECLTWCETELEYLEGEQPWTAQFLKDEGFTIHCILANSPTNDYNISGYATHIGGVMLMKALEQREAFFQRIGNLAQSVITLIHTEQEESK